MICSDIWHKYHLWYFKIVSNFTRLTALEITYSNFEISLVVFMLNTTTNPAITHTNLKNPLYNVKEFIFLSSEMAIFCHSAATKSPVFSIIMPLSWHIHAWSAHLNGSLICINVRPFLPMISFFLYLFVYLVYNFLSFHFLSSNFFFFFFFLVHVIWRRY